jgi:Delta3-Delta2-enoyl-CoA isomerase
LPHYPPQIDRFFPLKAKPSIWIIELHNGQDNRLTETMVTDGLMPALDAVEKSWREKWRAARAASDANAGGGALIIVGRRDQDKFFSNGALWCPLRLKRKK